MENKYKLKNGYNIESTCDMALYLYGRSHQHIKAMEELGELIQALSRAFLKMEHNVEEEAADVEIMMYQLKTFFNVREIKWAEVDVVYGCIDINEMIEDLSYLINQLARAFNGLPNDVEKVIPVVERELKHIRSIFNEDLIEKYKYEKLERLIVTLLELQGRK